MSLIYEGKYKGLSLKSIYVGLSLKSNIRVLV